MKHSARDFAQAEFARHPKGNRAFRRIGVITGHHWIAMDSHRTRRLTDQEMVDEGWELVQTVDPEPVAERIRDPHDLTEFASNYGLREDWHEPDEKSISARIIGRHLDNAMGSTTRHEHADWGGEFNVVLTRKEYDDESNEHVSQDLAVVNLATLLSWAAQYGEAQR